MQQLLCQPMRNKIGLAIFAGLVVFANVAWAEQLIAESQGEKGDQRPEQSAISSAGQVSGLEIELQKVLERAQLAQKIADLAEEKLGILEATIAEKEDELEAELREAEERARSARIKADLAQRQRSALESELRSARESAQLAEKDAKKIVFEYSRTAENGDLTRQEGSFEPVFDGESSTGEAVSGPATDVDHGHIFVFLESNACLRAF
jgi:hypothetical protein